MNPWLTLGNTVGWILLVIIILVVAIILGGLALSLMQWIQRKLPRNRDKEKALKLDDYLAEAHVVSTSMYKDDIIVGPTEIRAFVAGARWGWGYHNRK